MRPLIFLAFSSSRESRVSHDASFRLHEQTPQFSARRVTTIAQRVLGAGLLIALSASAIVASALTVTMLLLLLCLCYAANIWLRVLLFLGVDIRAAGYQVSARELTLLEEAKLPLYSTLVPLDREAHMVAPLAEALKQA